jgi:hypothetical protein
MVKYAVNNAAKETQVGALSKLLISLQFYNTYNEGTPVITREELLEEEGYPRVTKFFKYLEASWPGLENLSEYTWVDEQNNVHIRSTDDEQVCKVSLSSNGFQITVTYLHLLPSKKPSWVEVENTSFGTSRRLKMAYEYAQVT